MPDHRLLTAGRLWIDRLTGLVRDVRYASRLLVSTPGYSLVVVAVLALGIGTSLVVFGLFQAVALTPLAGVRASSELQFIMARTSDGRDVALPYRDYEYVRDRIQAYDGLAGSFMQGWMVGRGADARRAFGEFVTANYFDVLGVGAQHGRTFNASDERRPVVVLADPFWRRQFGADPSIVGRTIHVNREELTVIGVADARFRGAIAGISSDLFLPYRATLSEETLADPAAHWVFAFGRPRDGLRLAAARAEAVRLAADLSAERPSDGYAQRVRVVPIWSSPQGAQTFMLPAVVLLGATAAVLLLVVSANVAGLVLVRSLGRRGEIAARLAVGASRGRVVRLLLLETLLLAVPGACAGYWFPALLEPYLYAAQPSTVSLPLYFNAGGSPAVAAAVALACASALLSGLVPAVRASRLDLATAMKDDLSPRGSGRSRMRRTLVVAQVAMSLVLLVVTVLASRSLEAARRADTGFDAAPVASVLIDLLPAGYDASSARALYARLLDTLRRDPAIESASLMKDPLLMMMEFNRREFAVEGHQRARDEEPQFLFNVVGTGHFATLGIPLLTGRDFDDRDVPGAPGVVIVNETLARRYFGVPDRALGRRVQTSGWPAGAPEWKTIVGVAADITYTRLNEAPRPYVYLPHAQAFNHQMFVHARGRDEVRALTGLVERHIRAVDSNIPILDAAPLADQTRLGVGVYDMTARTLRVVALVAIALTALGIYGIVAYTVQQATHEIGIRAAIGARQSQLLARYLGHGLALGLVGAAAGIALALAVTRLMVSLLYGVTATDVPSFAIATAVVLGTTVAASLMPAWTAARIAPIVALRRR
jgi:predicted permease